MYADPYLKTNLLGLLVRPSIPALESASPDSNEYSLDRGYHEYSFAHVRNHFSRL